MGYFDQEIDRRDTGCLKWDSQFGFGQKNGLLPFWIADMDLPTVPEVVDALKARCDHPVIGYSAAQPSVYAAIASWWERHHGWNPETEQMLLSFGVVTAIGFTLDVLVEKDDKVLVFTPVYDPFFAAVKNGGRTLVDCPLRYEDRYYTIDWELFEKELQGGVKAVLFCNPHNPVGRVWTEEEMQRLTDLCAQYDVYLLSDEIHADFGLTHSYTTAAKFASVRDKLVVYTAISKTFNLAGMGSSCMFIPNAELKAKIRGVYAARWMFGPDALSYTAMEAAYTHGDAWLAELKDLLRENVATVNAFFEENLPKASVAKHEGTFLMWLDLTCLKKPSEELSKILAKEYGIALGIGSHFGAQCDGFMRLNIGCPKSQLLKGLEQLKKLYEDYLPKGSGEEQA